MNIVRAVAIAATALAVRSAPAQQAVPRALIERTPAVAVTKHTGTFGGAALAYTAIVEDHVLTGADGVPNASLITIAYLRDDAGDPAARPVMFVFNGGPGASSSPLHMNGLGPRRTTADGTIENPDSPLDVTDLVFIDPVGTGFSRPYTTDAGRKAYWSRSGDASSVKRAIDMWLAKHGRQRSPRYLTGESYGTTRVGMIFRNHKDVRFDGVLLVAVLGDGPGAGREIPFVTALPTMATSAWFHGRVPRDGRTVEQVYADAVRFARTDYLSALVQGTSLAAAERTKVATAMARLTGLSADFLIARNLRPSKDDWMLNVIADRNLRTGMLDTRLTARRDTTRTGGLNDPSFNGGTMRIGTAMLAPAVVPGSDRARLARPDTTAVPSALESYLKQELQFATLESYRSLNLDINGVWDYEGFAETNSAIADAMRANGGMRLFWTGGYFDLTTPLYATQYSLDQVGLPADRVTAAMLPGPHGVFSEDESRHRLAARLRAWIR